MQNNQISVLGLGNILLQDEGAGVHSINLLKEKYQFNPAITIIDGGTTGSDLLPFVESSERIIIIDAINFGQQPGFVGMIENDDILRKLNTKMSLHHLGLSDVLSAAKLLDIEPSEICLIGVQPACTELGLQLSSIIAEKMDKILSAVVDKLYEWGVESVIKTELVS